MSFVVGLTGGIGSGKSVAADRFAALGAAIVDTDVIAHQLTAPGGSAIAPIRATFGPGVMTSEGTFDRDAMRRIVFAAPAARARLEAILHPLIRVDAEARIRDLLGEGATACRPASAGFPYAVLVVPLLIEAGCYREWVDRVCVVDCPEEIQVRRVMSRSGLTRAEVLDIMAAQVGRAERLAAADDIIDNAKDMAALAAQVETLHAKYLGMAKFRQESTRTP